MKKLVLIIMAVIGFAGMSVAQDIWSVGYGINSSTGNRVGRLYKNGSQMSSYSNETYNVEGKDVLYHQGEVYWACNNTSPRAHVYKYTNSSSTYLNPGSGTHINALFYDNNNLYTVGWKTIDGVQRGVVWENDNATPVYTMGSASYTSEVTCGLVSPSAAIYTAGYRYYSNDNYRGIIWQNGTEIFVIPYGTKIWDMAYNDGYFYVVGIAYENNQYKLKVWYGSNEIIELYTLYTSNDGFVNRLSIFVDSTGDIYVAGCCGGIDKIWKNGVSIHSTSGFYTSVAANSNGVYHAGSVVSSGNLTGKIWKDGSEIYSPSGSSMINAFTFSSEPECTNSAPLGLPFFDGFENGSTSWPCWIVRDIDDNNGNNVSYWHRHGKRSYISPATGDYCAFHRFHGTNHQDGWLISPALFLQPGQSYTTLTFKTYEGSPSDLEYAAVLISTTGTYISQYANDFNHEVWHQSLSNASANWKTVTVDLSAYQGNSIYIAFRYLGTDAINWYIDDVSVTEGYTPCPADIVPYTNTFDNPDECWTAYDADMSNSGEGGKTWKHDIGDNDNGYYIHQSSYGMEIPQLDYLFSKRVTLPSGNYNYTLSFLSTLVNFSSSPGYKNSVWIAVDKTGDYVPSDYTTKLWEEDATGTHQQTVEVDLSAYKGHTISIAFRYEGNEHNWVIDDFSIKQEAVQYTITANANNSSWGTVSGGGQYNAGETCTLTATPASGYHFESWKKNGTVVSTNASYSFTVTENATYTAYFNQAPVTYYTINTQVTPAGTGTVTGGGGYYYGDVATLTATANSGYVFQGWQDGNAQNPRTITVTGNATYTAYFTTGSVITHTLTVMCNTSEGTVSGGGIFVHGASAIVQAFPNPGYAFTKWSDENTQNPRTIIVKDDMTLVAYFATGVDENPTANLKLYPNPAKSTLRIAGLEAETSVQIYNSLGELVKVVSMNADEEIDVSDLATGLYLLRCGSTTLRFVKEQ